MQGKSSLEIQVLTLCLFDVRENLTEMQRNESGT